MPVPKFWNPDTQKYEPFSVALPVIEASLPTVAMHRAGVFTMANATTYSVHWDQVTRADWPFAGGADIVIPEDGLYQFNFGYRLDYAGALSGACYAWLNKNGAEVTGSETSATVGLPTGANAHLAKTWNVACLKGDVVNVRMMQANSGGVAIDAWGGADQRGIACQVTRLIGAKGEKGDPGPAGNLPFNTGIRLHRAEPLAGFGPGADTIPFSSTPAQSGDIRYDGTSRDVIVADTGWYICTASAQVGVESTGAYRKIGFMVNGFVQQGATLIGNSATYGREMDVAEAHYLTAGDRVSLRVEVIGAPIASLGPCSMSVVFAGGPKGDPGPQGPAGSDAVPVLADLPHVIATGPNFTTVAADGEVRIPLDTAASITPPFATTGDVGWPIRIPEDGLYLVEMQADTSGDYEHSLYWVLERVPGVQFGAEYYAGTALAQHYAFSSQPHVLQAGDKLGLRAWNRAAGGGKTVSHVRLSATRLTGAKGDKGDTGPALPTGTAWPASPTLGQRFFNLGVRGGLDFYFDGQDWVSVNEYPMYLGAEAYDPAVTVKADVDRHALPGDYDVKLTRWDLSVYCVAPQSLTAYRHYYLMASSVGNQQHEIASATTAEAASGGWASIGQNQDLNLGLGRDTWKVLDLKATAIGTPGAHFPKAVVYYRLKGR